MACDYASLHLQFRAGQVIRGRPCASSCEDFEQISQRRRRSFLSLARWITQLRAAERSFWMKAVLPVIPTERQPATGRFTRPHAASLPRRIDAGGESAPDRLFFSGWDVYRRALDVDSLSAFMALSSCCHVFGQARTIQFPIPLRLFFGIATGARQRSHGSPWTEPNQAEAIPSLCSLLLRVETPVPWDLCGFCSSRLFWCVAIRIPRTRRRNGILPSWRQHTRRSKDWLILCFMSSFRHNRAHFQVFK